MHHDVTFVLQADTVVVAANQQQANLSMPQQRLGVVNTHVCMYPCMYVPMYVSTRLEHMHTVPHHLSLCMHEQATNEVQQTWLSAHTHTLLLKLKVIEEQLLVLTYTSDTMPALRKVDDHLTKAQRKLDARDKQVSCVLHWPSELCAHHISSSMLTARP